MKPVALVLVLVLALSCTLSLFTVRVEARTIVVPDNYPSIAAAIANARDGDTVYVRSGFYEEHALQINKAISLIGEDPETTIIKDIDPSIEGTGQFPFPENPSAIQINADDVVVSGFTVVVRWTSIQADADRATITGNILNNTNGIFVNGFNNTVTHNLSLEDTKKLVTRDWHIYCGGARNVVAYNTLKGPSYEGIVIFGSSNVVYANTLTNASGIELGGRGDSNLRPAMPSGLENNDNFIAKNNITGPSKVGSTAISITGSNNRVVANRGVDGGCLWASSGEGNFFYANHVERSGYGVHILPPKNTANNIFSHNNFVSNWQQISENTVKFAVAFLDDGSEGNFWSDYNGTDLDDDGIGDTPYGMGQVVDRYPLMAPYDIDSVAVELPEWVDLSALKPPEFNPPETLQTAPIVVAYAAIVVIVGVALLIYFRKHREVAAQQQH